jgi:predicted regulator of Ras-like GTPase activity (Roadblock/LC7/MglB family)
MIAFVCGFDGILIDSDPHGADKLDIDFISANFATVLKNLNSGQDKIKDLIATFDGFVVCLKVLDDCFVGIIMGKDGNIGRAKFELGKIGGDILNA